MIPASATGQAGSDSQATITIGASASELDTRIDPVAGVGQAANRMADLGLDALLPRSSDRSARGAWTRLARLWFVNLPVASLAHNYIHDAGHLARLREFGVPSFDKDITSWPWPIPVTISIERIDENAPLSLEQEVAIQAAGEGAARALADRMLDRIYRGEQANYFDWVLFGYAKIDFSTYGLTDLSNDRIDGDFSAYTWQRVWLEESREPDRRYAFYVSQLRHAALWSLADYSLVSALNSVGRYLVTGQRHTPNPVLRLGPVGLVPGAYADLTPDGPERGADLRLVTRAHLTTLSLGAVDTATGTRLWRAAGSLHSRLDTRPMPEVRASLWQQDASSIGGSVEIGARGRVAVGAARLGIVGSIGYKTRGYMSSQPLKASPLASISVSGVF